MKANATLIEIARTLRRILIPPRPEALLEASQLIRAAIALKPDASSLTPDDDKAVRSLSFLTDMLMRLSQDPAVLSLGMQALVRLGRPGSQAAAEFLRARHVSPAILRQAMGGLRGRDRILLAAGYYRRTPSAGQPAAAFMREFLLALSSEAMHEVVASLLQLAARGETLPHPVRKVLTRGGFPDKLLRLLAGSAYSYPTDDVVRMATVWNDQDLSLRLGEVFFKAGDPFRLAAGRLFALAGPRASSQGIRAAAPHLVNNEAAVVLAALDILRACRWPRLGQALAGLYRREAKLRPQLLRRVPLLSEEDLDAFLDSLPTGDRRSVIPELAALCIVVEPEVVGGALDHPALLSPAVRRDLRALVPQSAQTKAEPLPPPPARVGHNRSGSLLTRFFGQGKKEFGRHLAAGEALSNRNYAGDEVRDLRVADLTCRNLDLSGCLLVSTRFENVVFHSLSAHGSCFEDTTFVNCVFTDSDFRGAMFLRCRFESCTLRQGDAGGAHCRELTFVECSLSDLLADGLTASGLHVERCDLERVVLAGSRLDRFTVRASTLHAMDFGHVRLVQPDFGGVLITESDFSYAVIIGGAIRESRFDDVLTHGLVPGNLETRTPQLLMAMVKDRARRYLAAPDVSSARKAQCQEAALREMCRIVVRHADMSGREAAMSLADARRRTFARHRMGPEREAFLQLVPLLLTSDGFERATGRAEPLRCRVDGYLPDLEALRHFESALAVRPDARPPGPEEAPVSIACVYAMGSLGTSAQTAESDADIWVCCEEEGLSEEARLCLKRKLAALSGWAQEAYGLEAHFFDMTVREVHVNDFGATDRESSGSAQVFLLKEEFYRTALRLAGRHPSWWCLKPGIDLDAAASRAAELDAYPLGGPERLVNLGPLADIPAAELFGACLWQIVKSLHSPFKTAMKFGLLERYARMPEQGRQLLCDMVKEAVVGGEAAFQHTDPYTVLFRAVRDFYRGVGDKQALKVIKEAYLRKGILNAFDNYLGFPSRQEDEGLAMWLFGDSEELPAAAAKARKWTFQKTARLGAVLNTYLMGTYSRIRDELAREGVMDRSDIKPEDLTKLGRRIIAAHAPKQGKIERLPYLHLVGQSFGEFHFLADKNPGRKARWHVKGKRPDTATRYLDPLREDSDPARLLVWLAANELAPPEALLQADPSIAPLSIEDIRALLAQIAEVFPPEQVFDPDPAQSLEEERVERVLFILNLADKRDARVIKTASVAYSTNWGELFCRTFEMPDPGISKSPYAFLTRNIQAKVDKSGVFGVFIPRKSLCPRISLMDTAIPDPEPKS